MSVQAIPMFSLAKASLIQDESIEPYLNLKLNIRLPSNGNNDGITSLSLFALRVRVKIANNSDQKKMYELGYADLLHGGNTLNGVGSYIIVDTHLALSPHSIHKIEHLREGKDLYFYVDSLLEGFASINRNGLTSTEPVRMSVERENYVYKYNRSEWIDDLAKTEFDKIELFEVPIVEFPDIAPTRDILRFLNAAEKAMKEGRWDDVHGDCRNALNALYRGIDEWGTGINLTTDENTSINAAKDKTAATRKIFVTRLSGHAEKGDRLDNLRSSLYKYLSLEPHGGEYQDVHFNRDEASFALRATGSFCAIVLKRLEHELQKLPK